MKGKILLPEVTMNSCWKVTSAREIFFPNVDLWLVSPQSSHACCAQLLEIVVTLLFLKIGLQVAIILKNNNIFSTGSYFWGTFGSLKSCIETCVSFFLKGREWNVPRLFVFDCVFPGCFCQLRLCYQYRGSRGCARVWWVGDRNKNLH